MNLFYGYEYSEKAKELCITLTALARTQSKLEEENIQVLKTREVDNSAIPITLNGVDTNEN
jgi:hypothetical protein